MLIHPAASLAEQTPAWSIVSSYMNTQTRNAAAACLVFYNYRNTTCAVSWLTLWCVHRYFLVVFVVIIFASFVLPHSGDATIERAT